jgi:hypothetical protein
LRNDLAGPGAEAIRVDLADGQMMRKRSPFKDGKRVCYLASSATSRAWLTCS